MNKSISRIIGVIMLIVAFVFIISAAYCSLNEEVRDSRLLGSHRERKSIFIGGKAE